MKTFVLPLFILLLFPLFAAALGPDKSASLYEHLKDVNAQWNHIEPTAEQLQPASFENDTRRIQAHLFQVEQFLRAQNTDELSTELLAKRMHLLDVLHGYAEAAVFPKNYDYSYRIPYFIDAHNTACAVGYLIIEDGHKALAELIQHTNNNQYLLDMTYPELGAWVATSGFTAQELALIQPGYPAETPFSYLEGQQGGTNGHVNDILVVGSPSDVYVAGSFTTLYGESGYSNIGMMHNGVWDDMDGGLNGEIHTMAIYNNELYVGGNFSASVSGVSSEGLIKWTGTGWESANPLGFYGIVYALQVYNGKLYIGGDYELPTGALRGYLSALDGTGGLYLHDYPMGPVYAMTILNNKLILGGSFTASFNSNTLNNIAAFDDTSLTAIGNGLDANIKALAIYNDLLYVGGAFYNDTQDTLFGFGFWADTVWVNESYLARAYYNTDYDMVINDLLVDGTSMYVAGDFMCCDAPVAYYGYGLGIYYSNGIYGGMGGVTSFNDGVNTISIYEGELLVGGAFDTARFGGLAAINTVSNLGGIALRDLDWNSVDDIEKEALVRLYPVPASNTITLQLETNTVSLQPKLNVYNALGQSVSTRMISELQTSIDVAQWPSGVYMYQLSLNNGQTSMGRFVVE